MGEKSPVEKSYLPAFLEDVPQSLLDRFAPNLAELEKDVQEDIAKLRKFTEGLDYPPFEDSFYLSYLRVAKYNYKKAKRKLKHYCHVRSVKLPDFYAAHLDTDMIRTVLEKNMLGFLPYRDEDGNIILYTRGSAWSEEICDFKYFVMTFMLIGDMMMRLPISSITGSKYIADVSVNHYSHYYVFQKNVVAFHSMIRGISMHFTQINIVHDITLGRHLYYMIRPILPKKLTQRVVMHGDDLQSLHSQINPDILPCEYGGTMGSLDNKFFIERVLQYAETFKEEQMIFENAAK